MSLIVYVMCSAAAGCSGVGCRQIGVWGRAAAATAAAAAAAAARRAQRPPGGARLPAASPRLVRSLPRIWARTYP